MQKKTTSWVTKSVKEVYSNPWLSVTHRDVLTPAGTEGIYGVIHFKNHAVGVIPIDAEGNTWLVQQTRYPLGIKTWEIPEGGVPSNEEPIVGAKRELMEEVGLSASHWQKILEMDLSNSVTDEKATVFVAKELTVGDQNLEETEDIVVKKLPLKKAIAMVMAGEITDAISVAGLLKVYILGLS